MHHISRIAISRITPLVVTATLSALTVLAAAPIASADDTYVALPLPSIGLGKDISFAGVEGETTLTVPVSAGLAPASLDAAVQLPIGAASGTVEVVSDGRVLGRTETDTTDERISLPLRSIPVIDNSVTFTLRSFVVPRDNVCPPSWDDRSLALIDPALVYSGIATPPAALADFYPPTLQRLHIHVPADPSPAETAAALIVGTSAVKHYGSQPLQVDTVALPADRTLRSTSAQPFERDVVITEADSADIELRRIPGANPALVLTGSGNALTDQARLLWSNVAAFAVSSKATAGSVDSQPILTPGITTLRQLGIGSLGASGIDRAQTTIRIDQAALGRPSGDISLQLRGTYTPLPEDRGGLISVAAGDHALGSWAADTSGTFDRRVDIPNDAVTRNTPVTVTYRASGTADRCGAAEPIRLQVDPDSPISSSETTPNSQGFQALPQALLPRVDVALSTGSFDDVARAVTITTGLQTLSPARLDPELVSMTDAAASTRPTIVVAADGALPTGITPLFDAKNGSRLTLARPAEDGSQSIDLGSPAKFGSLQAIWTGNRMVVAATSTGAPGELDRVLAWLSADRGRWFGLDGDALVGAAGRDPVDTNIAQHEGNSDQGSSSHGWVTGTVAGLATLAVLGVGAVLIARRRRNRVAN